MRPSSRSCAEAKPLRVGADHEGFADEDAGAVADGEEGLRFSEGHAEGFFAEDVLAGFGGADGPGNVELVGERVVDGVDAGVGEEFFVGAVGGGDVELGSDGRALARSREAMAATRWIARRAAWRG
jgi:hypothetical protein